MIPDHIKIQWINAELNIKRVVDGNKKYISNDEIKSLINDLINKLKIMVD